ncbi:MAG: chloride channel protein [Thermoplasmataceae archaeon]
MKFAILREILNRILSTTAGKWALIGIIIGIVAGFGALAFYTAINLITFYLFQNLTGFTLPRSGIISGTSLYSFPTNYKFYLIPVSIVIGGLLSGFIVYKFAPEAEGHGTDAAIDAFHNKEGRIRKRIPLVKTVASAITIGSGGSAGREGPTAQIAAGFGSMISDIFKLSDKDRRIAVAAGIGAGIGSIFLAPLGGAILSTEILYKRDFEVEALIPAIIASVVGYSIFGYFVGYKTIFDIPITTTIGFFHPIALLAYFIIGIGTGLGGIFYVKSFYGIQGFFSRRKKIPRMIKPAIGALLMGLIAMQFPEVIGLGYGWVQQLLDKNFSLFYSGFWVYLFLFFILIFVLKVVATSLTIGSGGSGGVFAPGIVSGAFLGMAIYVPFHALLPYFSFLNFAEFIIVAMIAFFGGISKAPIAIIIMGTEMTGSYALFIPLMLATTVSYFISGNKYSIYRSQVNTRRDSPAHSYEYENPIMDKISVFDAMKRDFIWISSSTSIREAISKVRESKTKSIMIMENDRLVGYLSIENIDLNGDLNEAVSTVMSPDIPKIGKGKNILDALNILTRDPSGKLAVVEDNDQSIILGTIGFTEIADAYNREIRRIKSMQKE